LVGTPHATKSPSAVVVAPTERALRSTPIEPTDASSQVTRTEAPATGAVEAKSVTRPTTTPCVEGIRVPEHTRTRS
jgi:hypothetical protein